MASPLSLIHSSLYDDNIIYKLVLKVKVEIKQGQVLFGREDNRLCYMKAKTLGNYSM